MVFFYPVITSFSHKSHFSKIAYLGTIEEKTNPHTELLFSSNLNNVAFLRAIISNKKIGKNTNLIPAEKYISILTNSIALLHRKSTTTKEKKEQEFLIKNIQQRFEHKELPNGRAIAIRPTIFPLKTYTLIKGLRKFRSY